jgi:AraC-like DNA-binding protein
VWDTRVARARPPDRVVPDACPELIVHLGDPFRRRVGRRWRRQPRAFLAGTLSRPWLLQAGARVRTIGVRFRPGAVTSIFRIHMAQATDREVPLEALVGRAEARELTRRLAAAGPRGLPMLERWLVARRARNAPRRADVTRPAVSAILAGRGRARIRAVADRLGVHPRRLERGFARDLGIRPKLFARIVRLNAALAALGSDDRGRAVDWALEAGYFDQAHLSRDFRAVAGRRASAPREDAGELGRHFIAPGRLLAYLADE